MNLGWIQTYGIRTEMTVQLSFATEGGSGTPAPDLSIEVDELDAALDRMKAAGFAVEYDRPTSLGTFPDSSFVIPTGSR